MNMETILDLTWAPAIVFGICLGYAVVLLTTKSPKILMSKKFPKMIKNPEKYALEGGKLLLFFALSSLLMCFLLFVNIYLALGQIITCIVIFGILWKKMSDKFGPIE